MLPIYRPATDSEIPIIDLKGLDFRTQADKSAVVTTISKACKEEGFFYVVNHGVGTDAIDDMFSAARTFFDLPMDKKEEVSLTKSGFGFRGYLPSFHKGSDPKLKENLQEAFQIHNELPSDDPDALAGLPLHGPNPFPSAMPDLRERMLAYKEKVEHLGQFLLSAMAVGLGLPEDHFNPYFRKPMPMLRLLHYRPQRPDESGDHIGTRGHTDTSAITILAQDQIGGLEILLKSGEWVTAPPIKGSYIVNLGELMKAWSDGIFAATPHRVINRYGHERYSVPYFVNPDYHTSFAPHVKNPDPKPAIFDSLAPNDKGLVYGDWLVDVFSRIYHKPEAAAWSRLG
jgi:isopenicillin N synthase-like dioxygenase